MRAEGDGRGYSCDGTRQRDAAHSAQKDDAEQATEHADAKAAYDDDQGLGDVHPATLGAGGRQRVCALHG